MRLGFVAAVMVGSVLVLAQSCATPSGVPTAWMDPVSTILIPPSNVSELTYGISNEFHRGLHASMKGNVPKISVRIPQQAPLTLASMQQNRASILENDPALVRWTTRIRYTEGTVVACPISRPESGIWSFLAVLANVAAPWVNEYVTYAPAESYHSVIWYDRANDRVERIEFLRRSAVTEIRTMTCQQLSAL
jgi:hypothetical protein